MKGHAYKWKNRLFAGVLAIAMILSGLPIESLANMQTLANSTDAESESTDVDMLPI